MKNLFPFCLLIAFLTNGYAQVNDIIVAEPPGPKVQGQEANDSGLVYTIVEVMPKYGAKGTDELIKFISSKIQYPSYSLDNEIQGVVYLNFIVNEEGHLENIRAIREVSGAPDLTNEAIRVVKLTDGNWQPGTQNGKVVKVSFNLPIRFELKKD